MQPRELTISGLTSFTGRTTIDFTDTTLFALVGATGAGKSSIIDAFCLALYGRIPRLNANEVAPVIATGASECTVGLSFTVRGVPHRVVRTIRRRGAGASTLEATLEQLDDDGRVVAVLAGTADDVTDAVTELLGLSFTEFTRAVVLPQDDFARVLGASTSERQQLLARLLGTGVYDRLKTLAGQEARGAEQRAVQTAHQIAQLGEVSDADLAAARHRVEVLDRLVAALTADAEELSAVRERYAVEQQAVVAARTRQERLAGIPSVPTAVRELGDRIATADEVVAKHRDAVAAVQERLQAAEAQLAGLGDPEALTRAIHAHQEATRLAQAAEEAAAAATAARQAVPALQEQVEHAEREAARLQARVTAAHREHAAARAAHGLAAGDDCPVCARPLETAPALQLPGDVTALEQQHTAAVRAAAAALARHDKAVEEAARAAELAEQAARRAATAAATLTDLPSPEDAEAALVTIRQARADVDRCRTDLRAAEADLRTALEDRASLDDELARARQQLDRLRIAVGELDPPPPTDDVVASWEALHTWAVAQRPAVADAVARAERQLEATTRAGTELRQRMERACADAGLPGDDRDPLHRALSAQGQAAEQLQHLSRTHELVANLRAEEADARERHQVAKELAHLLRSDQFQKWLLDEATRDLVAGAAEQLRALSTDAYELALDSRGGIVVVDLTHAGETRSVRTLSGGERFLASLALALSLAEQIADSAAGPVALDALFVDEGFGSLDAETLDVAAGAIEQLGAGDRMVGIVSHVPELADRMPTRFHVTRGPHGSTVRREDT